MPGPGRCERLGRWTRLPAVAQTEPLALFDPVSHSPPPCVPPVPSPEKVLALGLWQLPCQQEILAPIGRMSRLIRLEMTEIKPSGRPLAGGGKPHPTSGMVDRLPASHSILVLRLVRRHNLSGSSMVHARETASIRKVLRGWPTCGPWTLGLHEFDGRIGARA